MKFLSKISFFLFSLLLISVNPITTETEELPSKKTFLNHSIKLDGHTCFIHSEKEVDDFILAKYNHLDFTIEEKMDILIKLISGSQKDELETNGFMDEYYLFVGIFLDGSYEIKPLTISEVELTNGPHSVSLNLFPREIMDRAVLRASVTKNGVTISTVKKTSFSRVCNGGDDRVELFVSANLNTSGVANTSAFIGCND